MYVGLVHLRLRTEKYLAPALDVCENSSSSHLSESQEAEL